MLTTYADYLQELHGYCFGMNPQNEMAIWVGNSLAGMASMSRVKDSFTAVGLISEEYEGKGIITRCITALMDYAFANMNVHRFVIGCAVIIHRAAVLFQSVWGIVFMS